MSDPVGCGSMLLMLPSMALSTSIVFRLLLVSGALLALSNLALFSRIDNTRTEHWHMLNASDSACGDLHTIDDVRRCYPSQMFRRLPVNCHNVENWEDLQRCLTGPFVPIDKSQQYVVHILGERNSGTKWLQGELQQCFPRNNFHFKAKRDFIRSKHFFQPIRPTDETKSIIVSLFRHPVDWVAAMREAPYHSPRHTQGFDKVTTRAIPMPWREFVRTSWATKRTEFDLELIRQGRLGETVSGDVCVEHFALDEVVPCRYNLSTSDNAVLQIPPNRFRGYEPIYELRRDHSGRPFANILELRREKIVNFALEVPLLMQLGGYAAVRYEDMLRNGTRFILEHVARMMGMDELPAGCRVTDPQPDRISKRIIDPEFRRYVEEHVDVATERILGYM